MKVLITYASKYGSTKGIAEFIGDKLRQQRVEADVREVGVAGDIRGYDAFVIGSAVYTNHWLKEARQFISRNRTLLASRPVWLFSSGPTGTKATDSKGRDLREVSGPKEIEELRESINPREHRVFFGALYRDRLRGAIGLFARWIPKEEEGDFRDWGEIEGWTISIAEVLEAGRVTAAANTQGESK